MSDILSDKSLYTMCSRMASVLCERNLRLATVESCSGGWIAKACTDLPGSSAWFAAGLVTYSNKAKQALLGIDELLIRKHGVVSTEIVAEMLKQTLCKVPDIDIAVAVSGIAGPDGGSMDKPVGTVWIGWQMQDCPSRICHFSFAGTRDDIRRAIVAQAVQGIVQMLNET